MTSHAPGFSEREWPLVLDREVDCEDGKEENSDISLVHLHVPMLIATILLRALL